jgi:hypothetical protein
MSKLQTGFNYSRINQKYEGIQDQRRYSYRKGWTVL